VPERERIRAELAALIGPDEVLDDPAALARVGRDTWVVSVWRGLRGSRTEPACAVRPRTTADVAAVLAYANRERVPVVPFGAGSGVCGAVLPSQDSIVVDLGGMRALVGIDERNLLVTAQAGMLGSDLETSLNDAGFSMGHFPQSIALSSVGGWVATRSAGQYSTKYGNIEDMLVAFEAVLPSGAVLRTRPVARAATGPDVRHLFLGAEGTTGILTEVTFQVHPLAEANERQAIVFPSMAAGLEALRLVVRAGWRPAVLRLYDAVEAGRAFAGVTKESESLLLVLTEGPAALVAAESEAVVTMCRSVGGRALGGDPVNSWLHHRNAVPGFEVFLKQGMVVDTIEVAATWSRIGALYDGVLAAVRAVPDVIVVSGHSSHSYPTGTNIYFTFAGKPARSDDLEALYFQVWDAAMGATLAAGGTISHHHGIGRVRRGWLERDLGTAYPLLEAVKHALDPNRIMNPGALLPDRRDSFVDRMTAPGAEGRPG
jgi:alkyldihydroxyacetonephosphate synthase